MLSRMVASGVMVLAVLGIGAGPALADGLVLDGTSVEATKSGGDYEAEVDLLNTGPQPVTLPATAAITATCGATVSNRVIDGYQSGTATLKFDAACFGDKKSVTADLDGSGPLPKVTIKKPEEKESDWAPMWLGTRLAISAAVLVLLAGLWMRWDINKQNLASSPSTDDQAAFAELKRLVDMRVDELDLGALAWKADLPAPDEYGLTSEVSGLDAGWSFKDSWAANLTIATTALVALVNSADTLKAVTGKETDAALGVMTVAGLISAIVIAIANTLVKLVGKDTTKVTVLGLVSSTSLVVGAATFQTVTVGAAAHDLAGAERAQGIIIGVTIAVGLVLLGYAFWSMYTTLDRGAPERPEPDLPAESVGVWAAIEEWEREIVLHEIKTKYKKLLTDDVPALRVPSYELVPMMVGTTSPGDDRPRRRASMI